MQASLRRLVLKRRNTEYICCRDWSRRKPRAHDVADATADARGGAAVGFDRAGVVVGFDLDADPVDLIEGDDARVVLEDADAEITGRSFGHQPIRGRHDRVGDQAVDDQIAVFEAVTGTVGPVGRTRMIGVVRRVLLGERDEELAPLRSEFVQVNYAKASGIAGLLKADGNSLMTERGSVSVDARTNTLLIRDTASALVSIRQLVSELDVPVRQVLIEARIVIADDTFNRDLGVRFGVSKTTNGNGEPTQRG